MCGNTHPRSRCIPKCVAGLCCACRTEYDAWHCVVYIPPSQHDVAVYLCRSLVTTELESNDRMKNQHGHGVCRMSTGMTEENGLNVKDTHRPA